MKNRMTNQSVDNVKRADNFLIQKTDDGNGFLVLCMLGESSAYIHGKFAPVVYPTEHAAYQAIRRLNGSPITLEEQENTDLAG
mgnify:CR=1 FL=1